MNAASRRFTKDLVERVASTFVAGFAGAVALDVVAITDLGWKAWLVTGATAGLVSVVKGFAAKAVGSSASASLSPGVPAVVVREVPPERIP